MVKDTDKGRQLTEGLKEMLDSDSNLVVQGNWGIFNSRYVGCLSMLGTVSGSQWELVPNYPELLKTVSFSVNDS